MKILLVHPKINYDNMEPLGLLSLGTVLKQNEFTVKVLDVFPDDDDYFLEQANKFEPDLIGFGFETPGYTRVSNLVKIVRKELPQVILCAGGIHVSTLPKDTLCELGLDFIIAGEAEISFLAVCKKIRRKESYVDLDGVGYLSQDGTFRLNKSPQFIDNLDALPIIDRTILDGAGFYSEPPGCIRGLVNKRSANLMVSRGCPHSCSFCQSHSYLGKRVRLRSVEHVLSEIRFLRKSRGIDFIYFADDGFTFNHQWLKEFCDALIVEKVNISWGCQSRADRITEPLVQAMKKAGCLQIDIGIESGDQVVLDYYNKGETIKQFEDAARLIRHAGIRLLCSFVIGAPNETWQSIILTRKLIRKLRPSICQYFTLVPFPGTALERDVRSRGVLGPFSYSDASSQKRWETTFITGGLSPVQQIQAKLLLQRATFIKDHLLLVIGWFRYPAYLVFFLKVAALKFFFVREIVYFSKKRNPVGLLQAIYHALNYELLRKARKRECC
jgi:radical SAM superfamily enzyme YgiQ (UPF0313 family)